jgi:hypothetical protein
MSYCEPILYYVLSALVSPVWGPIIAGILWTVVMGIVIGPEIRRAKYRRRHF